MSRIVICRKTILAAHLRTSLNKNSKIKGRIHFFLSLFLLVTLVDGVCTVANCVGKELAPHVKKHGSKLVPESLKRDKDGKSTLDGALVVAASSVQGNKQAQNFHSESLLWARFTDF